MIFIVRMQAVSFHFLDLLLPIDTARELETSENKLKPNCFAVGPLFMDPSIRTYYISCGKYQCGIV